MANARASNLLRGGRPAALAPRLGLLAGLWVALVEGHAGGLLAGLVALPLALWASFALEAPGGARVHLPGLLRLLPPFLWQALSGSLDVARRALQPRMRLAPGWLEARSWLPEESARLLLASLMSLVPGTLAVEVEGPVLTLHVLDARPEAKAAMLEQLRELEGRVARVFGLPPPPRVVP